MLANICCRLNLIKIYWEIISSFIIIHHFLLQSVCHLFICNLFLIHLSPFIFFICCLLSCINFVRFLFFTLVLWYIFLLLVSLFFMRSSSSMTNWIILTPLFSCISWCFSHRQIFIIFISVCRCIPHSYKKKRKKRKRKESLLTSVSYTWFNSSLILSASKCLLSFSIFLSQFKFFTLFSFWLSHMRFLSLSFIYSNFCVFSVFSEFYRSSSLLSLFFLRIYFISLFLNEIFTFIFNVLLILPYFFFHLFFNNSLLFFHISLYFF